MIVTQIAMYIVMCVFGTLTEMEALIRRNTVILFKKVSTISLMYYDINITQ